jgi:hypothetical protein
MNKLADIPGLPSTSPVDTIPNISPCPVGGVGGVGEELFFFFISFLKYIKSFLLHGERAMIISPYKKIGTMPPNQVG